ncbi:MAG: FMN-binding domain protein [Candidatus Izimaplasma bacterium HR2]|nr:MAG: FMN-binding domain protein [Candidatus Izimaplasma bacterium HR2]
MKKRSRIILFIFLGILIFGLIMAGYGTLGLKKVLNEDIESIDLFLVEDGEYIGEYDNYRWSNTVEVTIENHEITAIRIIESGNQSQAKILDEIINAVLSEQQVDIDTVSGASATTNSLLKAIEDALK